MIYKTSHSGSIIDGIMHGMLAKSWRGNTINEEKYATTIIGRYRNITDFNVIWVYNIINIVPYDTTHMLLPIMEVAVIYTSIICIILLYDTLHCD